MWKKLIAILIFFGMFFSLAARATVCVPLMEHKFSRRCFFYLTVYILVAISRQFDNGSTSSFFLFEMAPVFYETVNTHKDTRTHTYIQFAICLLVLWSLSAAAMFMQINVYNEMRNSNQQPNENLLSIKYRIDKKPCWITSKIFKVWLVAACSETLFIPQKDQE